MTERTATSRPPEGRAAADAAAGGDPSAERDRWVRAFRNMILARVLEDKLSSLYHSGKIVGGVYTGKGQEAFSAALGAHLEKGRDIFAPLIRDQAGRLAFGEPIEDAPRTYFGSALGPMRGRDGNVHRGRPREGLPAMISHLGTNISVVAGMLWARRMKGAAGSVGGACIGEGGTSTGAFHEAVNLAAVERLPLVIAVANNRFAYSTPVERQFACRHLVDRAAGYGIAGHEVDGTDLSACLRVFGTAVAAARAGGGPQLVVGDLLRLSGHGEHDDAFYVSDGMREQFRDRDPIEVAAHTYLHDLGGTGEELDTFRREAADRVQAAIAKTRREAGPDPFEQRWSALSSRPLVAADDSHAAP